MTGLARRTVWVAVLVAFGLPRPLCAQPWSAAQQEIIDLLSRCNDAWVASIEARDFSVFAKACPQRDDAVYWYSNVEAPGPYTGTNAPWKGSATNLRRISWAELQPVAVQLHGDTALIYYSVVWRPEPYSGPAASYRSRRLNLFRRQDGRWLMAGGMIAVLD